MAGETPHSVASIADEEVRDGRLSAPSAARNIAPILTALRPYLPDNGYALELASGTGEHAISYARSFPGIVWQPTDIASERLDSIDAWRAQAGLRNMRLAQFLDATQPDWCAEGFDVMITVNLMHLISAPAMRAVVAGVARSLEVGGRWCLYGPFRSGGGFRSDGDQTFHQSLTAHDPDIGYKDVETVEATADLRGFACLARLEMPANNLMLIFEKRPH